MSLYCGYGTIAGANMCLMSELSSIFLKICYLFPKDQQTHPVCLLSFIIFLIAFTVLRIIMYPALLVFAFTDTAKMWDIRSYARSQVMWPNMGLYVGVIFLQFFWYYLIWKKLFKLVRKIVSPDSKELSEQKQK